jgi:hypothetical protein
MSDNGGRPTGVGDEPDAWLVGRHEWMKGVVRGHLGTVVRPETSNPATRFLPPVRETPPLTQKLDPATYPARPRSEARTRAGWPSVASPLDLKRARSGSVLPVLPSPLRVQPHAQSAAIRRLRCAIGWARLARSDVDQVFGTGAACCRASV